LNSDFPVAVGPLNQQIFSVFARPAAIDRRSATNAFRTSVFPRTACSPSFAGSSKNR